MQTLTNLKAKISKNQHEKAIFVKSSFIIIAIITIYSQDLLIIFKNALYDDGTYHILIIPILFTYLLYRKRKIINSSIQQKNRSNKLFIKHFGSVIGIILCVTGLIIYWYGSYTFTPVEHHMLTLPLFTTGVILLLFNTQLLKQLFFPVAFLFFLMPPPTEILYYLGSFLSNSTAEISNAVVNLFGINSTLSNNYGNPLITLIRPDQTIMNFSIEIACSGIYSIVGFTVFATVIAYITRGKLRNKLSLFIMGIPLIVGLNIIRITTILAIGYHYGDQLALQVFHSIGATVLMFIGTLILLFISDKAFKKPKLPQPCITCTQTKQKNINEDFCTTCGKLLKYPQTKLQKSDIIKIASIALIVVALISIQTPVFALTEGPAQAIIQKSTGEQGNTQILPQISGYTLNFVYRDRSFEDLAKQDASLAYTYTPDEKSQSTVWVAVEIASTQSALHRWETCLVNHPLSQGWQPRVTQIELRDIKTQDNPPKIARYFAFQDNSKDITQVVLYWFENAIFTTNGTAQTKHVKMSLIVYPQSTQDIQNTESLLVFFAQEINQYWQPIKTWSIISLALSQNGPTLAAATTTLLIALIIYKLILDRQEKRRLQILYQKLPKQYQQLLQAITKIQKQGNTTINNIETELQKLTNTPINQNELIEKLNETENIGLIKKTIKNNNDNPIIVYQSQIKPEK